MRIEGGRMEFKDIGRFTKVLEKQRRKYSEGGGCTKGRRKEGRKEDPTSRQGVARHEQAVMEDGVFCLSDIKEPVANFLSSPVSLSLSPPSLLPPPPVSLFVPRYGPEVIRDRVLCSRMYAYTRRVPGRSSGVPSGSLE